MKLVVIADEQLEEEFRSKKIPSYANVCVVKDPQNVPADSYIVFDLMFEHTAERILLLKKFLPRPVFINAVTDTLALIDQPFIRINAWPTFLKRETIEVTALPAQQKMMLDVFEQLRWPYLTVPDITGMVSARIISNIINEAYYTLNAGVGTKDEIDLAMKLGTHYPYGPFEWSTKIGLKKIHELLTVLSAKNSLYEVSTLLTAEVPAQ